MTRRGLRFALLVGMLAALASPGAALANDVLTVTTTAGGRVTGGSAFEPNTIDCGPNSAGDCTEDYHPILVGVDQTVDLTATTLIGWRFTGWTGCSSNPSPTQCRVLMTTAKS